MSGPRLRTVVADTSALVSLAVPRADGAYDTETDPDPLQYLLTSCTVFVPPAVVTELRDIAQYQDIHATAASNVLAARDHYTVEDTYDRAETPDSQLRVALDDGEADGVALAVQRREPSLVVEQRRDQQRHHRVVVVQHPRGAGAGVAVCEQRVEVGLVAPPERPSVRSPAPFERPQRVAVGRIRPATVLHLPRLCDRLGHVCPACVVGRVTPVEHRPPVRERGLDPAVAEVVRVCADRRVVGRDHPRPEPRLFALDSTVARLDDRRREPVRFGAGEQDGTAVACADGCGVVDRRFQEASGRAARHVVVTVARVDGGADDQRRRGCALAVRRLDFGAEPPAERVVLVGCDPRAT